MIVLYKLRAFTLVAAVVVAVAGFASSAMAFCSSCGVPAATYSAGYAAPVAYQASYAPTYTTAYAPAYTTYSSGWYPGYWLGRVNRSIWGAPTTTYYAPTYTAAYASTAYYAPSYASSCSTCTASYAPACSTCTASYAPACSTCSASYAPACGTCSTCDACAASGTTCASCAAGTVSQATYSEPVAAPATTTYGTPSSSPAEPTPALPPNVTVPTERTLREAEKPVPAEPPLQPEPQADATDDSATNLQAPKLFDPNDRTAERHMAPVRTAIYHKLSGAEPSVQPISWQQVERNAEGWSSASE
jgi:hypothetical protein